LMQAQYDVFWKPERVALVYDDSVYSLN
jgi:hypothetical protein